MNAFNEIQYWPQENFSLWSAIWPEAVGRKSCETLLDKRNGAYHSLNFIEAGKLSVTLGNGPARVLCAGTLFVIAPGQDYRYQTAPGEVSTLLRWMRVNGPGVAGYLKKAGMDAASQCIAVGDVSGLGDAFDELDLLCARADKTAHAQAIALLYRLINSCNPSATPSPESDAGGLAQRVRAFMCDDLELGYNVSQIANMFGLSRSGLFLHFKRAFGRSPVALLQQARIEKAKQLLSTTALNAAEVAEACGYSSAVHFMHHFKKQTGKSPGDFRRSSCKSKG